MVRTLLNIKKRLVSASKKGDSLGDLRKWVTGTALTGWGATGANSNQLARRLANTVAHNYQSVVRVKHQERTQQKYIATEK